MEIEATSTAGWPYADHWLDLPQGRIRYIDEGVGPTWCYSSTSVRHGRSSGRTRSTGSGLVPLRDVGLPRCRGVARIGRVRVRSPLGFSGVGCVRRSPEPRRRHARRARPGRDRRALHDAAAARALHGTRRRGVVRVVAQRAEPEDGEDAAVRRGTRVLFGERMDERARRRHVRSSRVWVAVSLVATSAPSVHRSETAGCVARRPLRSDRSRSSMSSSATWNAGSRPN